MIGILLLLGAVSLGTAILTWALVASRTSSAAEWDLDPDWCADYTTDQYIPMFRLLADNDGEVSRLTSRRIRRRIRTEKRNIFRGYLRNLIRDFNRMHHMARLACVRGELDRPDFGLELMRLQGRFLLKVAGVHYALAMHTMGISVSIGLESLIEGLQSAQLYLQPSPVAAS
ncbi:MAG: hypothetical protein HY820_17415 [Acidobacteria bacterium]|nr:hypothetical protein [Acidobacteriota bacterium]